MNVRSANYYDSLSLFDLFNSGSRLFGNQNIGARSMTNLQVAGQLGFDEPFIVMRWYARTDFDGRLSGNADDASRQRSCDAFARMAERVTCSLQINTREEWNLPISDLLRRRPREDQPIQVRDPWPIIMPDRAFISAQFVSHSHSADDVALVVPRERQRPYWTGAGRLWVHVEGVHVHPTQIGATVAALTRRWQEVKSVEDQITDWLLRQTKDADPPNKATIEAIRDAILEGRHRE